MSILVLIPRKKEMNKDVTIVYGLANNQIYRDGSTKKLIDFLLGEKINLIKPGIFIIENSQQFAFSKKSGATRIVKNTSDSIYFDFLNIIDKLVILRYVYKRYYIYIKMLYRYPVLHNIGQPFVIDEIIFNYVCNKKLIILKNLIVTQSSLANLAYVFELNLQFGKRIMIWYSANSIPIDNYRNTNLPRANANEVAYEVLPIDEHLVWSEDHKKYLAMFVSIGTIIRVCGSLMFYLPKKPLKTNKIFDLLVFDVTPYADIKGPDVNKITDFQNSIYNSISAKKFLTDILWVTSKIEEDFGLKLRISLKPKRNYTSLHNKEYLDFIRILLQNQLIEILEPEIDLYKTIGQSQVCISYPFTSPAIIARELAIPSVFYIDQKVMNENNHVHGVEFISEKFKLFNFIVQHCLGGQQ